LLVKKQPFLLEFQYVIVERWVNKSGSKHIVTPYQIIFEHPPHQRMLLCNVGSSGKVGGN